MPVIHPGATVLVSGVNGFLTIWAVRALLERGYRVRGTVRSLKKGEHVKRVLAQWADKLEIVAVDDITKEGAFDEAVKGVDAIAHSASPFTYAAEDPQELIRPAVEGTLSILKSAQKFGTNVKRIVITGSSVSILHLDPNPLTFTEADWNEQSIEWTNAQGKAAHPFIKYCASKTLAEKAAWDFYNGAKDSVAWDLAIINPPYVFGPLLHEISSVEALNQSSAEFYKAVVTPDADGRTDAALAAEGSSYADVRDVATAHVLAFETPAAAGQRFIVSAGEFAWQDWLDVANADPSLIPSHKLRRGVPGAGKHTQHKMKLDASKSRDVLGLKYRTLEETGRDIFADLEAKGF